MAIIYKWIIPQMSAHVEAEGESNVIYTVEWVYIGEEETYSNLLSGSQDYTYVAGDPFVPYEDTAAFEQIVIGWLEGSLDVPAMQATIAAEITLEKNPVNEDLYFNWMLEQ
tara:strand:+ start:101 stop:433 length:333 start_codon:yes stop_codon:yes gene_type:complete